MKLHLFPGACSLAPHIALHWSGQPFDLAFVEPSRLKAPEFRQLNPMAQLPVLVDGDLVLTQNAAILTYIAERFPAARLFGDGSARERAEAMRWLMLGNVDMLPMFAVLFMALQDPDNAHRFEASQAMARTRLRGIFELVDARLDGREWLAGFRSAADAYHYVMLSWARVHRVDIADLRHLAAFRERMDRDTGVQAALRAEGLLPAQAAAG